MSNDTEKPADAGPRSSEQLGLVERLRQMSRRGHWPLLGDEAADEIERLFGMLDRMDDELRQERNPRAVVQRALIVAAMLPQNQSKPAGAVRDAAVALFGQEEVDAAMQVWRPNKD